MKKKKPSLPLSEPVTIHLAEQMRKLRKQQKWTQAEVASVISMDRSTYSYYETAQIRPSLENLVKLAKIYHVTLEYLIEVE